MSLITGTTESSSSRTTSSGPRLGEADRLADHLQQVEGDARCVAQLLEGRTTEPGESIEGARIQVGEREGAVPNGRAQPLEGYAGLLEAPYPARPAHIAKREDVSCAGLQDPELDQAVYISKVDPGLSAHLSSRVLAHRNRS